MATRKYIVYLFSEKRVVEREDEIKNIPEITFEIHFRSGWLWQTRLN